MKMVNPLGRSVGSGEIAIEPRGCMCSHGAQTTRNEADGCNVCSCQCDGGSKNRQANNGKAMAVVRY